MSGRARLSTKSYRAHSWSNSIEYTRCISVHLGHLEQLVYSTGSQSLVVWRQGGPRFPLGLFSFRQELQLSKYCPFNAFTLSLSSKTLEVGRNPLVVSLMKGVYNEKPPVPKYTATWDPSIVLTHFDVFTNALNSLSILQLARKTVTLLALTSLSRCANLAAIQLRSISFSKGGVKFVLNRTR